MHSLVEQTREVLERHDLASMDSSVLVAVSGGGDSMALLDVLRELGGSLNWRLSIAHFNHHLRGAESEREQALVESQARDLGVPLHVGHWDAPDKPELIRIHGLEQAARMARHAFFGETVRKSRAGCLAMGHHAGDQVELFFLNLFRGTGTRGLSGMKPVQLMGPPLNTRIIRPFLERTKQELLDYLKERQLPFAEDSSNADPGIRRNWIRHHLIPELQKELHPAISPVIHRTMELIGSESEFLDALANDWIRGSQSDAFDLLSPVLQRRILYQQLSQNSMVHSFELVEWLRRNPESPIMVTADVLVSRTLDGFLEIKECRNVPFQGNSLAVAMEGTCGEAHFGGAHFTWTTELPPSDGSVPCSGEQVEYFDGDAIGRCIRLRHWQPGDRFQPIGLTQPAKLQDLFVNARVERSRRRTLVVAENAEGHLFWVEGLRIGEVCKVTDKTRNLLKWAWNHR